MPKKIRFPLEMADGAQVRDLEELREHFDLEAVVSYYKNGKLTTWLGDRYLSAEKEAVEVLDENAPDFQQQLCAVFEVEYTGEAVDLEEVERRQERLTKLRAFTDEQEFIDHIDEVAFDQEELADLLDEGVGTIYLCGKRFSIPLSVQNKQYIGVNDPEIAISAKAPVDFDALDIRFTGTHFSEKYASLAEKKEETAAETSTAVRVKEYQLYSNMLTKYEVDDRGRRYAKVNAVFLSDGSGAERLFYAPSVELANKEFQVLNAAICGDTVFFTAHAENTCPPFAGDAAEAALVGDCLLKQKIGQDLPTLICNRLNSIGRRQIIAAPNGCIALTAVYTRTNRESEDSTKKSLDESVTKFIRQAFGSSEIFLFIPQGVHFENKEYEIASWRSFSNPEQHYLSKEYDREQSFIYGSIMASDGGFCLSCTKGHAYLLLHDRNWDGPFQYYKMGLIEMPIIGDASPKILSLRTVSYSSLVSRILDISDLFMIQNDLILYLTYNEDTHTIEIYRRKNLSEPPELLLQDDPSNFSIDYCVANPVFTVRDGAVYCCYQKDTQPTYLCELQEGDALPQASCSTGDSTPSQSGNPEARVAGVSLSAGRGSFWTIQIELAEAVTVDGVQYERIPVPSAELFDKLDLREGDLIRVHQVGDATPSITIEERRNGKKIELPEKCPSCGCKLSREAKKLKCGYSVCPANKAGRILTFMDHAGIKGIGESFAEAMVNAGIDDIVKVMETDPSKFEDTGWSESQVKDLQKALKKRVSEMRDYEVLAAIGIPGVGPERAKITIKEVSLDNLINWKTTSFPNWIELIERDGDRGPICLDEELIWYAADILKGLRPYIKKFTSKEDFENMKGVEHTGGDPSEEEPPLFNWIV